MTTKVALGFLAAALIMGAGTYEMFQARNATVPTALLGTINSINRSGKHGTILGTVDECAYKFDMSKKELLQFVPNPGARASFDVSDINSKVAKNVREVGSASDKTARNALSLDGTISFFNQKNHHGEVVPDDCVREYKFDIPKDLGIVFTPAVGQLVTFDVKKIRAKSAQNVQTYVNPNPQVTCTLTSDVASAGANQPVTLSWTSQNADTVEINNGIGQVVPPDSGSVTTLFSGLTTNFILVATNLAENITATCSALVNGI